MDKRETENWIAGMRDYIAPKGKLDDEHLSIVLLQVKERLDTQMDGAVLTAALCDLLVARGVIKEKELDGQVAKLADEMNSKDSECKSTEEPDCGDEQQISERLVEAHRLMGLAMDTHDPEITELASYKLMRVAKMMRTKHGDVSDDEDDSESDEVTKPQPKGQQLSSKPRGYA